MWLKKNDYGWLPPWGLLTNKTIENLYESNKTKFEMKDKSVVYLCTLEKFPEMLHNNSFSWISKNPGICHFST